MAPKSNAPRKRVAKAPAPKPAAPVKAKVASPPPPEPVVEKSVESAPVSEDSQMDELGGRFTEFLAKIQSIATQMSSLKSEFRTLEKAAMREMKAVKKLSQKKKRKNTNRAPSGFVKPTLISTELATFLGKPNGTEMARTEVTREINKYIRSNDLQDKTNGRKINPDDKLRSLLKLKKNDELTYFNLQRYMSPHFAKQNKGESASSSS
jgi:chromatin remodeling complex protein RSC6